MPKLDLTRALRIKTAGGEVAALKGAGFSWVRSAPDMWSVTGGAGEITITDMPAVPALIGTGGAGSITIED